jgi:hypothetical protein
MTTLLAVLQLRHSNTLSYVYTHGSNYVTLGKKNAPESVSIGPLQLVAFCKPPMFCIASGPGCTCNVCNHGFKPKAEIKKVSAMQKLY